MIGCSTASYEYQAKYTSEWIDEIITVMTGLGFEGKTYYATPRLCESSLTVMIYTIYDSDHITWYALNQYLSIDKNCTNGRTVCGESISNGLTMICWLLVIRVLGKIMRFIYLLHCSYFSLLFIYSSSPIIQPFKNKSFYSTIHKLFISAC